MLTVVKYFIAEVDIYDEPKHPNVIKFVNRSADEITLMLIKKRLEALGAFRYFFKTTIPGGKEEYVWEDFIEDLAPVPTFNNEIVLKALRLEDKLRRANAAPPSNVQVAATPPKLKKPGDDLSDKVPASPRESSSSRLSLEESQLLESLEKETHFSLKELKSMYIKFKKEAPTLEINKEGFVKVTEGMGIKPELFETKSPQQRDKFLQELIFNKFDSDKSGSVDFAEFAKGMSIITRGTPEEKLESAFKMYDFEGKGLISRVGFIRIMQSFMDFQGGAITLLGKTYKDTLSVCDEFFSMIDKNGDGEITFEEYKQGAMQHPELLQALRII